MIAIVAIGFMVLYKAVGVVNLAHGDFMTMGAYVAVWGAAVAGLPVLVAYVVAIVCVAVGGLVLERTVYTPLRNQSLNVIVIATLGVALTVRATLAVWQGSEPKRLASPVGRGAVNIAGAAITYQRILIVVTAAVVIGGLSLLFRATQFGREMRALAADREAAQLQGIRVRRLGLIAFGLSGALAALAGVLIAPLNAFGLGLGFGIMLMAFAAAILGGFQSFGGVVLASLAIGITQQLFGGYVMRSYAEVLPFAFMLVAIVLRPQGFAKDGGFERL